MELLLPLVTLAQKRVARTTALRPIAFGLPAVSLQEAGRRAAFVVRVFSAP
jgi:hypothetical protein